MFAQIIFLTSLAIAGYFLSKSVQKIVRNIRLGQSFKPKDAPNERLKQMILVAFGQQKMFQKPIPAILHAFVYIGFVLINLEILEIVLDGILGTHRLFSGALGSFYSFLINFFEVLALGVLITCSIFLLRRNVLNIRRFHMPELKKFPLLDANSILTSEILLMFALLSMNACDSLLQGSMPEHYPSVGDFFVSQYLISFYSSLDASTLHILERVFWWFHILGIMAFANYLPYSKHLHIIMAFPNTFFSNLEAKGKIRNMPVVTREVKSMLSVPLTEDEQAEQAKNLPVGSFGAKDVDRLTWKNLMDAYTCTECGRCSAVCPANLTGKLLSPRKIMMDTRDRLEEVGTALDVTGQMPSDGKALYGDYISSEELLACTTCNACTQACPVNIDPLDIILQLRRYRVMEEAKAPDSWNAMFSNLENNQAPWKFPSADRENVFKQ